MKGNNIEGKLVSISAQMEGVVSRVNDLFSGEDSPVAKARDDSRPHGFYQGKDGDYVVEVNRSIVEDDMLTVTPRNKMGGLTESDMKGFWKTMDHVLSEGVGYSLYGKVKSGNKVMKVYMGEREPTTRKTELRKIA